MERRLRDILPTRRDVLKWGGAALAGSWIDRVVWPLELKAAGKATPRNTARNCIVIELAGAISPQETFDYKETPGQPKDLDVRKVNSDLYLSKILFPTLIDHMDRVSIVRSLRTSALVHFNGLYHSQTGRPLNPALAREIPAYGSIIAFELEKQRRETDTFPTYMSTNLTTSDAGSIGAGFLPARFTALDLNPSTIFNTFGGEATGAANAVLQERWNVLTGLAEVSETERRSLGEKASDFKAYYHDAYRILNDERWLKVFRVSEEEKKRYGANPLGLGTLLAKNLIAADAGTRFVYVQDALQWDHHQNIFTGRSNIYTTSHQFDAVFTNLMQDLSTLPGHASGKTLLDETLVVVKSEFGRTPHISRVAGRDHWRFVYPCLFAGGGVKPGRVLGKSDESGASCTDTGWKHKEQPWPDNVVGTIYSALGIDWTKSIANTPSGRAYDYVQTAPLGASEFISNDAIDELFA